MTRRRATKATTPRLDPHWKVRVAVGGALLHLASRSEPIAKVGPAGRVEALWWEPIEGYGDTVAFIDWPAVTALSWRYAP